MAFRTPLAGHDSLCRGYTCLHRPYRHPSHAVNNTVGIGTARAVANPVLADCVYLLHICCTLSAPCVLVQGRVWLPRGTSAAAAEAAL